MAASPQQITPLMFPRDGSKTRSDDGRKKGGENGDETQVGDTVGQKGCSGDVEVS